MNPPSSLLPRRLTATLLRGLLCTALLAVFARAQDLTATVAPNIPGTDNYVDIKNPSSGRLQFYSSPTPAAARMSRLSGSEFPWPGDAFGPDPGESLNRLYPNDSLRVYPKTVPGGTVIEIPFTYGSAFNPTYKIRVTVTAGAQVISLLPLDASPSSAQTVRWQLTFDQPVSGVTAGNFSFTKSTTALTGQSITSVTADTAQPSVTWTVTADSGRGGGRLGLNWANSQTESPKVINSSDGFSYDLSESMSITSSGNVLLNPGNTTQLWVQATSRSTGGTNWAWYKGSPDSPSTALPISGELSSTYTPPVFNTPGVYGFFCFVLSATGEHRTVPIVVTVANPPVISSIDGSRTGTAGKSTTLTAVASGATNPQESLVYQWYQGNAPDTSHPVGGNSATFTTPALTDDTSYWVQVSNGGQTATNSSTVTITVREAPSLVVTTAGDVTDNRDGKTSLREAVAYANSLSGAQTITFAPALAGQTITLANGWTDAADISALVVTGNLTIQGPATAPGIVVAIAQGVQKRHMWVSGSGVCTLANLSFTNGRANDYGGSIWSYGSLTVRGCAFYGNTAGTEGGAIQCWGDSPLAVIENSTFANNTSLGTGGAFDLGSQQIAMRHLTVVRNNSASGNAVALWKNAGSLVNSIVAANSNDGIGLAGGATLTASTNNLIGPRGTGGLVSGMNGNLTGVTESRLYLGTLGNYGGPTPTVNLLPGSPAINAGVAISGLTADQRGVVRGATTGGLLGQFYTLTSAQAVTGLLAPLATLQGLAPNATALSPRIDFGSGTESSAGDGSVLDRGDTTGNLFGGLGVNVGSDNVAALWSGYLTVPETANYRFTTRSDDGSVVYIDGSLVVDNNKLQSIANVSSGSVYLAAGRHTVRIAYFDATGGAGMQWSWEQLTGNSPFARQIVPPQALSSGSLPDIGAYEDGAGDDDPDGDTLGNFQESLLGSNPLSADTDGDGFNDATEMLAGSNPASAASVPPATHIERVLGYGAGRGLDLSGTFLYAVNVGTTGAAGQAGDATFTADNATGVTVTAGNFSVDWTTREFGPATGDNVLETVCNSDRWSAADAANATQRTIKVKLAALAIGRKYKLQLIFADPPGYKRVFDVSVNGAVIVPGFDTSVAQGVQSGYRAASAVVFEFTATTTEANIELAGASTASAGVDHNPILNGLTLEGLPTAAAAPVFVTAAGTYTGSVSVEISSPSSGASIRYTTDGSDPSETHGTAYTVPFSLGANATVKAISAGGGWLPSSINSASYTVLAPLSAWRSLQGLAADGSQDLLISSSDGVTNLLKYAFNMAPVAGSLSVSNTSNVAASGTAGLPAIFRDAQGRLTIRFVRRKAATAPGVTYAVETGTNPGSLQPLDLSGAVVESIDATWERVTASDAAVTSARFGRVKVSTQP